MNGPRQLVVTMFSGGRGTATIARELVRDPSIELNLLVNAYDDGWSTGEIREHVPGMLGPSDFRKNLSCLMDLYSARQFALEDVLDYRFPQGGASSPIEALGALVEGTGETTGLADLHRAFAALDPAVRTCLVEYLRTFLHFDAGTSRVFNYADCAVGNILFAGAYLQHGRDFNRTTAALARLVDSRASLINVTRGENRILAALKEDGELLEREARIVSPQSDARIVGLFLLPAALDADTLARLRRLPLARKRALLRKLERPVDVSDEARDALLRADVILYGPGTQFSSLLPSYKTRGVAEAIRASRASVRAFVVNLDRDHDIQRLTATDIVDAALCQLGEDRNDTGLVTHVLVNERPEPSASAVALDRTRLVNGRYKGAAVVVGNFENPGRPGLHSGRIMSRVIRQAHDAAARRGPKALDMYIDLHKRTMALSYLVQEFTEVPWLPTFSQVRLIVNHVERPSVETPPGLQIEGVDHGVLFSEVDVFLDWLRSGSSEYLATISGDGEYRLAEVLAYINLLEESSFGVVFGSRSQSRHQFFDSLQAAYGESPLHYYVSWMGALCLSAAFSARYRVIFSDPLTGFRIYRRSAIPDGVRDRLLQGPRPRGTVEIARLLVQGHVEIAEVPVTYRTFRGYTDMSWRFRRGLRNAWSALG